MGGRARLIVSLGLVALVAVGSAAAVALARDKGGLLPVRSDDGIDRDECNLVHNITACDGVDFTGDGPAIVTLAREDLAALLGIDAGDVSVLTVEPVEWPDTSLGNPQPGLFYLQVITPGYRLVLEARDLPYTYHTDLSDQVELVSGSEQPAA
jgi:hypothetical protein